MATVRRRQAGSGLLEFAIAAMVLAVLGWFLLVAVGGVQEQAEKKKFEMTVANIEAGLRYEASSRLARGVANPARTLLAGNPIRWLATRPDNYLGEYPGRLADAKRVGVWYYDQSAGDLAADRLHCHGHAGHAKHLFHA